MTLGKPTEAEKKSVQSNLLFITGHCFCPKHLNCSFGWANELSNLVMKKIEKQNKENANSAILLAVRTCGLFLLWINLTSRQGTRAAFFWAQVDLSVSQSLTGKMGLITGFFLYVLSELSLYTTSSTGEIWLSLPIYSMPCITAYTGLGFEAGWLICDWLVD